MKPNALVLFMWGVSRERIGDSACAGVAQSSEQWMSRALLGHMSFERIGIVKLETLEPGTWILTPHKV